MKTLFDCQILCYFFVYEKSTENDSALLYRPEEILYQSVLKGI